MEIILIVCGLALFEIINSVDNAVINAEVLGRMGRPARRWFLMWGIVFAVFVVRGVLPWLILWAANPNLSAWHAFTATLSANEAIRQSIENSSPPLLLAAGVFLVFLFLQWLFLEDKRFGLIGEHFIYRHGLWFYTTASFALTALVWMSVRTDPMLALGAVIGSSAFFLIHGFKENAEHIEEDMIKGKRNFSDWSKILYLEAIDACFSVDGVLGAFAFTLSIPLILIGNGIGAYVVRRLTVGNIDRVKKLVYLKNGAMYSVLCLGVIMIGEAFGGQYPSWLSPAVTFFIIGYFTLKSQRELQRAF